MTRKITPAGDPPAELPVVVVEDTAVLVCWDGVVYRCSADAAHVLSDHLFQAAILVERRQMESEEDQPE